MARRILSLVVLAATAGLALAQPKQPEISAEEKLARSLLAARIGMAPALILPGGSVTIDDTDLQKQFGGRLEETAYDHTGAEIKLPPSRGPAFVVNRMKLPDGRVVTRFSTLFWAAERPDGGRQAPESADERKRLAGWKFDPAKPEEIVRLTGAPIEVVKKNEKLIAEICKDRTLDQLVNDARFVRLLAGLSLAPKNVERVSKQNDAMAYERQAWVTVRRNITGLDKQFPTAFEGPRPIEGKPAPEVHEGTEAEAGMKPGSAAKIDAVLTEWAANDDQAFAVCIVRKGVIVLHKAYGTRDGKPMTVDTPSWMASITKPMSASLMLMLVDRDLVSLDDPADKSVPALRGIKVEKPLLIRHLHTHTNGLDKWPSADDT